MAPTDPTARQARTSLSNLMWLFVDEPATAAALRQIASEVGINIDSDTGVVDFDELGPRLTPDLERRLFSRLRRRYDEVLDERLLGDRTSRPIIQPESPSKQENEGSAPPEREPLSWTAFAGDVEAEMRRLLASAGYSLRLAAQEGKATRHLKRSTQSLAEAYDWYGMLKADGRHTSAKTVAELGSLRRLLDELIDYRLGARPSR